MGSDVRDDMRDEAGSLVHLWVLASPARPNGDDLFGHIRDWCVRLTQRLEELSHEELQPLEAVLAAQASVLRLQTAIPGPVAPARMVVQHTPPTRTPSPDLGGNQKRVLAFVREHPDVRTKELIEHFSDTLSDRTVKRCLKDLVSAGVLVRAEHDGSVQYRAQN
jgi:hypothetical protein